MWIRIFLGSLYDFNKPFIEETIRNIRSGNIFFSRDKTKTERSKGSGWFNYKKESFKQSFKRTINSATLSQMSREEALKVFDIEEPFTEEELEARFEKLYTINDPIKGGSFYLRGKFVGAKEVLLKDMPKSDS